MVLKSQVELTPPRPGQLGTWAGSGEDLIRLNSSEFKNSTSNLKKREQPHLVDSGSAFHI